MVPILEEKLKDFGPESDKFKKKSADMKILTALENKTKVNQLLTKSDLLFLYEINTTIEGFGYEKDPRVEELRGQRNANEDMLTIFECSANQVAHNTEEINENTVAYLGEWNPTVLQTVRNYPNIKHLYESFPDKKIFLQTIETDPSIQTPKQAEEKLKEKSIYLSDWGRDILYKTEFSKQKETYELVRFTVEQLGFPNGATTEQIYDKADSLGLGLCPAEVGPHLRLSYSGEEWMLVAMEQIADRDGYPYVFRLRCDGAELKLSGSSAKPSNRWRAHNRFMFLLRKRDLET